MGSAIFFDLVEDKTIDGFHSANVVTMMTSPLSGTLVPAGAGRTEVQGIGVQSYPIGWFTRSNFGGRFSTMLKSAGWDGIVLEGKADKPVWIDIPDGKENGQTTQRPAVVAIGPAGENLSRMACLIHDASNGSGQGAFGAVWGSKNLKAVSVIGAGSIEDNDPKALMQARLWQKKNYAFDLSRLKARTDGGKSPQVRGSIDRC